MTVVGKPVAGKDVIVNYDGKNSFDTGRYA